MKTPFEMPYIDENEMIGNTKFWLWLKEYDKREDSSDEFIFAFLDYCVGFDKNKHTIPTGQIERHRNVFSHFHWLKNNNSLLDQLTGEE
jgi:hypothetical protein